MRLFAQNGFQEGKKIEKGIEQNVIDGIIYSPKDITFSKLVDKLNQIKKSSPDIETFFDPQFYSCFFAGAEDAKLGNLSSDYSDYFQPRRRNILEREKQVEEDLTAAIAFQQSLPGLSGIIAPNIYIPRSFNSIEAVIAKNFIRLARGIYSQFKDKRPLYVTLALSREALMNSEELLEFLNEVTLIDERPDGFYLLIGARSTNYKTDIYNADVIAGWLLLNYSLSINGYKVINGYSDILTPVLIACGAYAGSTGWWSNLRMFSLERFQDRISGGRRPVQRYLSNILLNRITFSELNQINDIGIDVLNKLEYDKYYLKENEDEEEKIPDSTQEIVQSWEALKYLNNNLFDNDSKIPEKLNSCINALKTANDLYQKIPLQLDPKSNYEHIEPLYEGIREFARLAGINLPKE